MAFSHYKCNIIALKKTETLSKFKLAWTNGGERQENGFVYIINCNNILAHELSSDIPDMTYKPMLKPLLPPPTQQPLKHEE